MKYRKKKLEFLALDINKKKGDASSLLTTYDNILYKAFNISRNHLLKTIHNSDAWITKNVTKVNLQNDFLNANNSYLKVLGEKDFSFLILNASLKTSPQDSNWTRLWVN